MNNILKHLLIFCLTISFFSCSLNRKFESNRKQTEANPWTHLNFKDQTKDFNFAIVSDNSGGRRPGVFEDAIQKLNKLKPDFVISVGDLIDTKDYKLDSSKFDDKLIKERWLEFNNITKQLKVPFFYVAGNNDIRNSKMETHWSKQFGATYYHFKYKTALFIVLNSEDKPGSKYGEISDHQMNWLKTILEENTSASWTFIFLHRPMWLYKNNQDWKKIEELTMNRKLTVFAGHHHTYSKATANGHNYYGLATTGGASSLKFEKGQFDHISWVSVSDSIPQISNILLNGIWGDNPSSLEKK
ncbi:metallophosphoesterase family protein [Algibacter mikhailovii]|uniref:metallophosphoesterase family protein n=1 Tax=Algibacter mikhailovii TaxID=425498 RepID=UPI00249401D3|nr:metallophosphoesterase [Algibacter mikhailovii]